MPKKNAPRVTARTAKIDLSISVARPAALRLEEAAVPELVAVPLAKLKVADRVPVAAIVLAPVTVDT